MGLRAVNQRLQGAVEKRAKLRLGKCTDFSLGDFTVFKQHERWNTANTELSRSVGIFIDIELSDDNTTLIQFGRLIKQRCNHFTGAAPGSPIIDQNRKVGFEDVALEGGVCNVNDGVAHGKMQKNKR